MKILVVLTLMVSSVFASAQKIDWSGCANWKIYDISSGNAFFASVDSLSKNKFLTIHKDSIHYYLSYATRFLPGDGPIWMGAHVMSYEKGGNIFKILISDYGGFFYTEGTHEYFTIPRDKRAEWDGYLKRCYMTLQMFK